jgi:hypothetical protein
VKPFGRRGQVVFPNLLGARYPAGGFGQTFSVHHVDAEGGGLASQEQTMVSVTPSVDVFVSDHWSVGATPYVVHFSTTLDPQDSTADSTWSTEVGFVPRVGAAIPVGAGVVLWPQVCVGAYAGIAEYGALDQGLLAGAELPLVFPLTRHVFMTVGGTAAARLSIPIFGADHVESRSSVVTAAGTAGLGIVLGR